MGRLALYEFTYQVLDGSAPAISCDTTFGPGTSLSDAERRFELRKPQLVQFAQRRLHADRELVRSQGSDSLDHVNLDTLTIEMSHVHKVAIPGYEIRLERKR